MDHNPQQTGAGFSRGYQQSEAKDGTVSPGHCFKQATQSHCLLRPSLVESVFFRLFSFVLMSYVVNKCNNGLSDLVWGIDNKNPAQHIRTKSDSLHHLRHQAFSCSTGMALLNYIQIRTLSLITHYVNLCVWSGMYLCRYKIWICCFLLTY